MTTGVGLVYQVTGGRRYGLIVIGIRTKGIRAGLSDNRRKKAWSIVS